MVVTETATASTSTQASATEENLWEKILAEASRSVVDRLEPKHLIILGDRNSGKSTLLARLQGIDISEISAGVALDYSFMDIHAHSLADDDPLARINVWQLEGETQHKNLLRFAINPQTIANSIALVCLDFTQPWGMVDALNRWLQILKDHIKSLEPKMHLDEIADMKKSLVYDFQQYQEPTATTHSTTSKMLSSKKKKTIEDSALLPLADGVLTNNLGIPIIVVVCKSDAVTYLEKDYGYKEAHFDFIQQYLRRICLSYGASLVYVSAKKDKNCDVLLEYIKHKCFGLELTHKMQLLEKELVFVPSGADSLTKINIDFENQNLTRDPEEPFEEIIKIPRRLQQEAAALDSVIAAEEDQEFLAKHKEILDKEPDKGKSSSTGSGLLQSLQKFGSIGPVTVHSSFMSSLHIKEPTPKATTAPTLPTPLQEKTATAIGTSSLPLSDSKPTGPPTNEHQVLADFFNSLIAKDRSGAVAPRKPTITADIAKGLQIPPRNPNAGLTNRDDVAKHLDRIKKNLNPKEKSDS